MYIQIEFSEKEEITFHVCFTETDKTMSDNLRTYDPAPEVLNVWPGEDLNFKAKILRKRYWLVSPYAHAPGVFSRAFIFLLFIW